MTALARDALQRALRGLAAPAPSPELLERILQSRAAGVRVNLPRGKRRVARWLWGALAAAAALALVISTRDGERAPPDTAGPYSDIAATLSFSPPDALAQDAGPPRAPRYEPVRLEAGRAHAGTWIYRTCRVYDVAPTACRGRVTITVSTITVSQATWQGRPTWLVSQRQAMARVGSPADTNRTALDTAYFAPATLRPTYAAMGGSHFRLVRWFTGDTMREALDIGGAHPRSWRAQAQIPGAPDAPLVLRWAGVDGTLLLQALPLERGWRGSVYSVRLIGPDPGKAPFVPLDLRVVGSERIEVPAGRFDCWKVDAHQGKETESVFTLWVSKDRGWLVKTELQGPEWWAESALLSATPPAP
jgi:hypothetical protein